MQRGEPSCAGPRPARRARATGCWSPSGAGDALEGEARDVRFVKGDIAGGRGTLRAAGSPGAEDCVVPLSPRMLGSRSRRRRGRLVGRREWPPTRRASVWRRSCRGCRGGPRRRRTWCWPGTERPFGWWRTTRPGLVELGGGGAVPLERCVTGSLAGGPRRAAACRSRPRASKQPRPRPRPPPASGSR